MSICKRKMYREFQSLLNDISALPCSLRLGPFLYLLVYCVVFKIYRDEDQVGASYYRAKQSSVKYWQARKEFLEFFPNWYISDGTVYEQFGPS